MNRFQILFISVLFFCTVGAGPCDVIDQDDSDADDVLSGTGECDTAHNSCKHSLDIEVLLAGNEEYQSGMYSFEIVAPDESVFSIDCYLPRADAGLDCNSGDLKSLIAWIDPQDYALIHFHVNGAPPYCTIRVSYNDFQLIEKDVEPVYDLTYPNGEGCEPICYNGEDHIAVAIY